MRTMPDVVERLRAADPCPAAPPAPSEHEAAVLAAAARSAHARPGAAPPRRRRRGRMAVLGSAVAAGTALLLLASVVAPRHAPLAPPAAAAALDQAAAAAGSAAYQPVRPGDYWYTKVRSTWLFHGVIHGVDVWAELPVERETWIALDGTTRQRLHYGDPVFRSARQRRLWAAAGKPELAGAWSGAGSWGSRRDRDLEILPRRGPHGLTITVQPLPDDQVEHHPSRIQPTPLRGLPRGHAIAASVEFLPFVELWAPRMAFNLDRAWWWFSLGAPSLTYHQIVTFPANPKALLRVLRQAAEDELAGLTPRERPVLGPLGIDGMVFSIAGGLLAASPAPPHVRAALYRVLAGLHGVQPLGETTDGAGRRGVAIAVDHGAWREELVFDPATSTLLAVRDVAEVGYAGGPDGTRAPAGMVLHTALYLQSGVTGSLTARPER